MTKGQKILLSLIKKKHGPPTFDEAFDIYTEHVMTTSYFCFLTMDGEKSIDYDIVWLQDKAMVWLKLSLGSLICQGELRIY